jgi:hypothetical protein
MGWFWIPAPGFAEGRLKTRGNDIAAWRGTPDYSSSAPTNRFHSPWMPSSLTP